MVFDEQGNLFPHEKIELTLSEFETMFVRSFNNERRNELFNSYISFISDLSSLVTTRFIQWVDGSFVTSKSTPNDIDLLTIIDFKTFESKEKLIHDRFRLQGAKEKYGIDAYTIRAYPLEHRNHFLYHSDMLYWYNWFGHTKRSRTGKTSPKGFVELQFTA